MTYANVAATLALVFAMGGSAVAASHYLITSTKQISPKVLKELRAAAKPGAPGAPGASGASGASGPNGLNGAPGTNGQAGGKGEPGKEGPQGNAGGPAAHWRKILEKPGVSKEKPEIVSLEKAGPFTITGHCYLETVSTVVHTVAATYIGLTEGEALVSESNTAEGEALTAGQEKPVSTETAQNVTAEHEAAFSGPDEGLFAAETTTGSHALDGAANEGVFLEGKAKPACYFSGYVVAE